MIDDPLSIVAAGIWLMAAGMYPIGFLFGACSDCCGECPDECSKCTHYYNQTSPEDLGSYTATLTSEFFAESSRMQATVEAIDKSADPLLQEDVGALVPQCVQDANPFGFLELRIWESLELSERTDECGCTELVVTVFFEGVFDFGVGDNVFGIATDSEQITINSCDAEEYLLELSPLRLTEPFGVIGEQCESDINDWLESNFSASVSLTIDECECGACCDDGCEENVAEGGCNTWQGVGVDCDPDPCI